MTTSPDFDVAIIGAGIVGLATALELTARTAARVGVFETEKTPAAHQTGHNSGVIHSGLYYAPGSSKARNCVAGRRELLRLCQEEGIPYELCGKLVIATDPSELPRLDELERRGRANGLQGLERLDSEGIKTHEPHAAGIAALWVPETGIIDYTHVAQAYARRVEANQGSVALGEQVTGIKVTQEEVRLTTQATTYRSRYLINCGGLQSDRIARMAGHSPTVRIVPFRGEYFDLRPERKSLLRGLIYPVPDPRFPFLGVHLTRRIDQTVEAGPNAVLAFHREGYKRPAVNLRDTLSTLLWPGTWRLAARYWRIGLGEYLRAGSRKTFARALQRFVPEIQKEDLTPGNCGIRAQALDRTGRLLDDFELNTGSRTLHVLNAPSPAATASLAIGRELAERAKKDWSLK